MRYAANGALSRSRAPESLKPIPSSTLQTSMNVRHAPGKIDCCPNTPKRKIARSVHEDARDVARRIYTTPEYQHSRHERKKVEMLFAHLKRILKLDKLRLRGPSGARDEFLLAATAQNLRRMAKWLTPVAQEAEMIGA